MNMSTLCVKIGIAFITIGLSSNCVGAATFVWTGANSGNWSDSGNWTNGSAPGLSGNDNVWLEPALNPPVNQDIAGLSINTLTFNTNLAGYVVSGNTITLKKIDSKDNNVNYQTNMLNCNVVIAQNNDWDIKNKGFLWINGSVGETGVVAQIQGNGGKEGTLVLTGSNTFTGGLKNSQLTVMFIRDQNLGILPGAIVSNYFESGYGRWRLVSTGGFNRVTVPATRGLHATAPGITFAAEPNTKAIINAPIWGTSGMGFNDTHHATPGSGTILLSGDSANLTGGIQLSGGILVLMHSNALGAASYAGTLTSGGTYDFNGYDSARGYPDIWNATGFDNTGVIKNNNKAHPSTISGSIGLTYGASIPFGGAGDMILTGPIWSSLINSPVFVKTGNGTLTLKGANTYTCVTYLHLGGLTLDYTVQNNDKIGTNAPLYLGQSALKLIGNDSGSFSQLTGNINIGGEAGVPPGASSITLHPGLNQNLTLAAQGISVAWGHAVDFRIIPNGSGTAVITTTNADGLFSGGTATWQGSTLAKIVSGTVTGMPDSDYLTSFVGGTTSTHVDVPAGSTVLSSSVTEQTLRFNASGGSSVAINAGQTLSLNGINGPAINLRPAILVTSNAGPVTISGPGGIQPGLNQNFFIHQYSASPMTISAPFLGNFTGASWYKCGPGELILTGTNGNNGTTYILGGTLTATSLGSNGVSSSIGQAQQINMANATFKYTGAATAHNRQIYIRGSATIDASGVGLLEFTTSTNVFVLHDGRDFPLTLTGTGEGKMDGVLDLHLGSVIKDGPGTWTLCGTQYYTGDTIVSNGTLHLTNNCVLARSLNVTPNGTLAGSATVQEDLIMSGTRRVEIRSDSDFDTLAVGYNTTLGGTLELVEKNGYKMPANFPMTIVSSGGGVSGQFATVTGGFVVTPSADGKQLLLTKRYPGFVFYIQ